MNGDKTFESTAVVVGGVRSHHVIPQANCHLSMSFFAKVEAVHRKEA